MSRLFVSFLGVNAYLHAKYKIGEYISEPVRYVQEALVQYLCRDWDENDKIVIFVTDGEQGSYRNNWLDGQCRKSDTYGMAIEPEATGLKQRLENLGLRPSIEARMIPDGLEERGIWKILETFYDIVNENDELYIDITHSFRFIPMIVPAMATFLKTTKNAKLQSIYYGALEALGRITEVEMMPLQERIAPIRDLKEIYKMIEWSEATNAFLDYGDAKRLKEQIDDIKDIGQSTARKLSKLKSDILVIDEALKYNNVSKLRKMRGAALAGGLDTETSPQLFALQKLDPQIEKYLSLWGDDEVCNALKAAEWCIEKDRYAQALTFAQEGLITYICDYVGWNADDWWYRGKVNFLNKISLGEKKEDSLEKYKKKKKKKQYKKLKEALPLFAQIDEVFRRKFSMLSNWRNTINHANEGDREAIREKLPGMIRYFKHICKERK